MIASRRGTILVVAGSVNFRAEKRCDGSGYHRRVKTDHGDPGACVLAATEIYEGLTTDRADRSSFSAEAAADELRRLAAQGVLDLRATNAVLEAAGHGEAKAVTPSQPKN